jgi:hypothetical protein
LSLKHAQRVVYRLENLVRAGAADLELAQIRSFNVDFSRFEEDESDALAVPVGKDGQVRLVDPTLCIISILAIISMFIVKPSSEYLGYIDFKVLSQLFRMTALRQWKP